MKTTEKLPEEFKTKLVAALRGGEYKQGKSALHLDGKYCCLGVACHLAIGKVPDGYFYIPDDNSHKDATDLHGFDFSPVPMILRGSGGMADLLADMNDGSGNHWNKPKSFSEIADYIEANL